MTMPSHKIKNAVFDMRFSSRTALLQENSSLGVFVKQGLMPVVDTVLSEHDRDGSVICIDKLLIDLGRLHYSDFKSQMARRLRAELDAILRSKIQHLQNSSDSRERIIPLIRRDLELITHFLLTGALTGSVNPGSGWRLDRRLQSILTQERSAFLRFLRETSHRPQVIQRLVRQFPAGTVRQVVRLLAPAQSETALKAVDHILRRNQSRSPTAMQTTAIKTLVWELLLDYLLQHSNSRFTTDRLSNWITGQLEQRQVSIPEALTAISAKETGKQVPQEDPTAQPGPPPKTIVPGKESRQIFKGYDLYQALRFYLQHGMMPWAAGAVSPNVGMVEIIEELKESHPEKLLKLANDLRYDPDLCRRLAGHLTPPMMTQLITALLTVSAPGHHKDRLTFIQSINDFADRAADRQGFLADIVRNLVTRQLIDLKQLAARPGDPAKAESTDAAFDPGQDPDLIRTYLTVLLKTTNKTEAHGSTFSRLLDELETKYPFEYRDYLAWLVANKKQFAAFLRLTHPQKLKKTLADLAGFPSAERTIEFLEKVFSTGVPSQSSNRTAILRILTQLIITTTFSDAEVFVQSAFIRLAGLSMAPGSESRAIEALETLAAKAEAVADEKIIRRLKDSLAAYQHQEDLESAAQKTPDKSPSTGQPAKEDETALIRYLTGDQTSHPISNTTAGAIFTRLIRQDSETLYAMLRDHLKDKNVIKKMVTLLSENRLTRVLAGLRPDLHLPVQTYADIIADACFSEELVGGSEKINSLKWEFIFTYLAQAGNRPFHPSEFIRRFIAFLADTIRTMDKETFTAVLSRNLTADSKSATRPAHLTVLRALGHLEDATEDLIKSPFIDKGTTEEVSALICYLTGDQTGVAISDATARAIFTRMIRHGSDTLYTALRDYLKDKSVIKKMIHLLSEDRLTRVLAGLRPDLHLPIQTYADIIADACYSKELFDRPEKINTLKWEFIFTYLAQFGTRPFHQSDFIRRFTVFLADNIRKMDKGTFTAVLSRNLTASIKPTTRPAHLVVLQELGHLADATEDLKNSALLVKRTTEEASALIGYLTGDQTTSPVSDANARALFTRLIRQDSETLYAMLRDHLKDKSVIKKMVTLLSEDRLTRVLAGLRPDLQLPVQTYADIIADACYSKELFDRPEKINTLKWEFIFDYLAQAGNRPFHQGDFIRRFMASLAGNIGNMDKETFTAALYRNLTAGIKPSASPAHLTVLRELDHWEDATEDLQKSSLLDKRTTDEVSALISYLTGDQTTPPISNATARAIFTRLIRQDSETLYAMLRDHLKEKSVIKKMVTLLSEDWLTRVLAGLRPDLHLPAQTYADIIADACYSEEIFDRPEKINTLKWEFIFDYLAQAGNRPFHQSDFIRRFMAFLTGNIGNMDKGTFTAALSRNLTAGIKPSASPAHLTVLRDLGYEEDATEDLKLKHPTSPWEIGEDRIEEVVVQNAGMIIAAPYLPQLWKMLELTEKEQFKDLQAAERAVHLLQFMTDENIETPEYHLVLNKILCGIQLSEPITSRIDITAKEREAIEGLIRGMIENWKTIGQTSVEGFRESFFQRRGRLTRKDDAWNLKVEPRAFDMLLDSIPWGFATIKHPWMERVVHVKWR